MKKRGVNLQKHYRRSASSNLKPQRGNGA
jgi:hypothetical protein